MSKRPRRRLFSVVGMAAAVAYLTDPPKGALPFPTAAVIPLTSRPRCDILQENLPRKAINTSIHNREFELSRDRDEIGNRSGRDRSIRGLNMSQAIQTYISRHEGEINDPPLWVLAPHVTLTTPKAAAFLDIAPITLIRYTDRWGLTVYRTSGRRRHYLISELTALRNASSLTADDIKRATKGGKNAITAKTNKPVKRQRKG